MTPTAAEAKEIQATFASDKTTVMINGIKVEISAAGQVTIFSSHLGQEDILRKPAIAGAAAKAGFRQISAEENTFSLGNIKVEAAANGGFTVHTNGDIEIKPVEVTHQIGEEVEPGIFYAGLTKDGTHQILVKAEDIIARGSFNQAAEAIAKLNADAAANGGHNDWQIGSAEVVQIVRENLGEGVLKNSFKKSFFRDRYHQEQTLPKRAYVAVTSTQDKLYPAQVATIRFTEGNGYKAGAQRFESTDARGFGARPIRLEPVPNI